MTAAVRLTLQGVLCGLAAAVASLALPGSSTPLLAALAAGSATFLHTLRRYP